jgi:hypothetical protein
MNLVFVHGWSVTHTDTYGSLHSALVAAASNYNLDINVRHIYLGKYVSFHDEVNVDDIARAFDRALRDLPGNGNTIKAFSAITHSTGGPVVRYWQDKYYGARNLSASPLKHLVMLAPANHGSALAILGKERVGRLKAWFNGVEPGQGVLDWLCLGSDGQWQLNENFLAYNSPKHNFFPFVLTGQGIDTKFYDFLNSYLVEPGSDGVVRVSGANLNYRYMALVQGDEVLRKKPLKTRLVANPNRPVKTSHSVPLGIFSQYSHSGDKMGIMRSPNVAPTNVHPVVDEILKCLKVSNAGQYSKRFDELTALSDSEQLQVPVGKKDNISRYTMLVVNVHDGQGNRFDANQYELVMLGGSNYQPDQMPKGFLVDKQMNNTNHNLVYYMDFDKLQTIKQGCFGINILARPTSGFASYHEGEFRSEGLALDKVFRPNETTYVDITMKRIVDKNVFQLRRSDRGHEDFRKVVASGQSIED